MIIQIIMNKFSELVDYAWKLFIAIIAQVWKLLFLVLVLFEAVKPFMIAVIVLVVLDQFTGVFKAIWFKKFKWKIFNRFYVKLILYTVVMIATFTFEEYLLENKIYWITKGVAIVIGSQELASVYLNVTTVTGKKYLLKYIKGVQKKLKE